MLAAKTAMLAAVDVGGFDDQRCEPFMHMWTQDESGRVHTPFEPVVLAATLALLPVLVIESDATSEGWQRFAEVANWAIWAVFAVELAAVLIVAKRKKVPHGRRLDPPPL